MSYSKNPLGVRNPVPYDPTAMMRGYPAADPRMFMDPGMMHGGNYGYPQQQQQYQQHTMQSHQY